ncbi:MAG: 4'-phosphopantetheinyl transferase superfamily protein [Clostridiales bacterium]|nr:4'-phosphopantetheinyl transferase superfamily protein [Clostridiales bacterium]
MNITDEAIQGCDRFIGIVSEEKRNRLKAYNFSVDKALSLYAELLVRWQVSRILDISQADIFFVQNEFGKPFLQGYSDFHFNVSHTRNAIAVAFSNSPIDIDVERVRSFDLKIARRYFMPQELDYILQASNQDYASYEIWTKKEAYIKYLGKGLSIPLTSFNVLDNKISSIMNTKEQCKYIISVCGGSVTEDALIQHVNPLEFEMWWK